ncbi:type VII secretion-associated serine protease mycosin [Streptomyces sp. MUM 2J]|uniref:type VII secretion-associated serine protease mycosin n=1 Tax=Streptomyces sp. MUM 2J TaxID=2791987 RepID=UPI001F03892C|nr:type VII secretion-associated serine protease mycosin [Streptomyces sp. MUM 2J]MCH0563580.1 type VII secretion-associated serine protease mycosin [Streptomyces sp. MUM 2J]
MPTIRTGRGRFRTAASALAALLLVGSSAALAQADTTRSLQWHLDAMHADEMWRTSTGKGVTVAVIDSGVDPTNPDLKGRILDGLDLAPSEASGDEHTDLDGHGTSMAGLIAGTGAYGGGKGAFGLAPGTKILPIRVPGRGEYNPFLSASSFADGIRYAVDHGAKVVNISMGTSYNDASLSNAVKYALEQGSLVFGAVGNSGDEGNPVLYPAATPGVVGVGSIGKNLRRSSFSEYGSQVDMAAPGEEMVHACGGKTGLCKGDGTSDATALASASAALIWSKHPTWTNNQILRVMLNTIGAPTDGAKRNDSIGYGIVRPRIALQNPGDPGPADVYPLPDLKAAAEKSPVPSASASEAQGGGAPARGDGDDGTGSNTSAAEDSGSSTLWVVLGVGAAAVLAAAGAAVTRRRRHRTTPPPPPGAPMHQPPHGNRQFTRPGHDGTPHGGGPHDQGGSYR